MNEFTPAPLKQTVGIEALDIRVGKIERVEEVPRSDKLMKLTVNFGDHSRTILAGMKKERENPKEIEGMQALFVLNLQPRKMAGEISEGCCSTSGTRTGLRPCSPCRSGRYRTALARVEILLRKAGVSA
jgi:tRNA-binding protein